MSHTRYKHSKGPRRHEDKGSLHVVVGIICVHFGPLTQKNPWLFKKLKRAVVDDTASSADGVSIVTELTK